MTRFSTTRSIVFTVLGLPIGFILTALAFAAAGRAIEAPVILPFAIGVAIIVGIAAGFWKTGK